MVIQINIKYYYFSYLLIISMHLMAQKPDEYNSSVVSIIGDDPVQLNSAHDFINTDPYYQTKVAPTAKQKLQQNQNIESTLENAFHMRFEVSYSQPIEQIEQSTLLFNDDNAVNRIKKQSMKYNKYTINMKKRIKSWLPRYHKKYRPHLCGRF